MKHMIFSFFLILTVTGQAIPQTNSVDAHLNKRVNLRFQSAPLREILAEISDQTNVSFVFSDSLIDSVTLSCDVEDEPLGKVFSFLLDDHITYKVIDDDLVVLQYQQTRAPRTLRHRTPKVGDSASGLDDITAPELTSLDKPDYPQEAIRETPPGMSIFLSGSM
ncbi:MAG: hypothetical protein U5R06_03080 [candidate division KSB1 bacterium]|nr:hypothetical protein [candidate division KSB1 bacterium]